jgi:hypothetical protein
MAKARRSAEKESFSSSRAASTMSADMVFDGLTKFEFWVIASVPRRYFRFDANVAHGLPMAEL